MRADGDHGNRVFIGTVVPEDSPRARSLVLYVRIPHILTARAAERRIFVGVQTRIPWVPLQQPQALTQGYLYGRNSGRGLAARVERGKTEVFTSASGRSTSPRRVRPLIPNVAIDVLERSNAQVVILVATWINDDRRK